MIFEGLICFAKVDIALIGRVIAILIVALVAIVNHLLAKAKADAAAKGQPRPRPRPPVPNQVQGNRAMDPQDPARNVEEFLRQVAQRKQGRPTKQQPQKQQPVVQVRTRPAPQATRTLVPATKDLSQPSDLLGEDVAKHVDAYMDSSVFATRSAAMGDVSKRSDQQLTSHMADVFDHKVGALTSTQGSATSAPMTTQQSQSPLLLEIIAMLQNPMSMRQTVILHEILQRPSDPWQESSG